MLNAQALGMETFGHVDSPSLWGIAGPGFVGLISVNLAMHLLLLKLSTYFADVMVPTIKLK